MTTRDAKSHILAVVVLSVLGTATTCEASYAYILGKHVERRMEMYFRIYKEYPEDLLDASFTELLDDGFDLVRVPESDDLYHITNVKSRMRQYFRYETQPEGAPPVFVYYGTEVLPRPWSLPLAVATFAAGFAGGLLVSRLGGRNTKTEGAEPASRADG